MLYFFPTPIDIKFFTDKTGLKLIIDINFEKKKIS